MVKLQYIQTLSLLEPVQSRQLLHEHFDFSFDECLVVWSKHNSLRGHLKPKKNIRTADSLKYLQGAMEGEVGLFYQVAKPVAEVSSQGAVVITAFELALPKELLWN